MKRITSMLAVVVALAAVVPAARAQTALVDGQVTKIDAAAGKITIRHGPMKKFDMDDGMTMVFRVSDPAMLKTVKVGEKVKFDADRINGQFTVTRIEKAK
jgi:Cu/Ag efflux protein CusF